MSKSKPDFNQEAMNVTEMEDMKDMKDMENTKDITMEASASETNAYQLTEDEQRVCNEIFNKLIDVINSFTETENRILDLYYGSGNNRKHSVEELVEKFDITAERIAQMDESVSQVFRPYQNDERYKHLFNAEC